MEVKARRYFSFLENKNLLQRQKRYFFTPSHLKADKEIIHAFELNNKLAIEKILAEEPHLLHTPLSNGLTALHIAVKHSHFDLIKQLIENHHVNINARSNNPNYNTDGMTPVFLATYENKPHEILQYLIEQGADTGIATKDGKTPLSVAVSLNSVEKVKLIAKSSDPNVNHVMKSSNTALIEATLNADDEIVKTILEIRGLDVNHQNSIGDTALFCAVEQGYQTKAKLIMQHESFDYEESRDRVGCSPYKKAMSQYFNEIGYSIAEQKKSNRIKNYANLSINDPKDSFKKYASDLNATPSRALYRCYLNEAKFADENNQLFSYRQAKMKNSLDIWKKIVAETDAKNQRKNASVKNMVIAGIKGCGYKENAEKLYDDCMTYLTEHTLVTSTFNTDFLKDELKYYRLMNVFELDKHRSTINSFRTGLLYYPKRFQFENKQFDYLSEELYQ